MTKRYAGYEAHPAAELFPLDSLALAELMASIEAGGQLFPVVLHEGRILDGRSRASVCERLGREPLTVDWDGKGGSPVWFAIEANKTRRSLTAAQKAAIATEAEVLFADEAKEAQRASGVTSANQRASTVETILSQPSEPKKRAKQAREKAAESVGASPANVSKAKKVKAAAPEVFEQMKAGRLNVEQAAAAADAPADVRAAVVAQASTGGAPSASAIRRQSKGKGRDFGAAQDDLRKYLARIERDFPDRLDALAKFLRQLAKEMDVALAAKDESDAA